MKNFLIKDNRALAGDMIKNVKAQDTAIQPSQSVDFICSSQRFLHYMAAKKLGFPVISRRKRLNDPDVSDEGENNQENIQSLRNRFLFNNKKSGGLDYGDQVEI